MYKFIICVLCDSRVQKRNSEFNLSFWPHPRITSRCIPIRVASRTRPDKNYVQIQKTAFKLGYITKLIVLLFYSNSQTLHYSLFKRRPSLRSESRKIKLLRHKIQSSIHSFHFSARSFWKRFREVFGNLRSFCYSLRFTAQKAKFRLKFT